MCFSCKQEDECVASCAGGVTGLHSTGPSDGIFTWLVSWLLLLFLRLFTQRHTLAAGDGVMALFLSVKIKLSVKSSYPVCFEFCEGWLRVWTGAGCVENGEVTGWLCGEVTGWLCGEWRSDCLAVWRMEK